MSVIDFSNFFSTLPTRVSFSLRKSDMPSPLCWFNPKQEEGFYFFPEPEEILREHWKATDKDLKALSTKGQVANIMKLMEGFCPPTADDSLSDDTIGLAVAKDSLSGEWLHVFQSQFAGVMCIGSVKESQFLKRVRSFYLLSKVIDVPTVDHNSLGEDHPLPYGFLCPEESAYWHVEFIQGHNMRDAQAKAASFLVTHPVRYRTWAVCMQVFGEEFYATILSKVDEKGATDRAVHHVQENIGSLASVCPPVQVFLFWRE